MVVWFTVSLGKTRRQVEEGKIKFVQNCVNITWSGEVGGGGGGGGILSMCVFF